MSILIKGMKMPNNCQECACINDEYFYCQAVGRKPQDENVVSRRPDWCPLAEIPTPHGRLIDADALHYSRIRIAHNDGTIGGNNAVVMSAEIKDAPTIIAAEE